MDGGKSRDIRQRNPGDILERKRPDTAFTWRLRIILKERAGSVGRKISVLEGKKQFPGMKRNCQMRLDFMASFR